ncbi:FtsK/SpoIIIE family protein [Geobacillus phage vB_GthS_PK3.6]|nr:FtsK/SpoIIIE family protein [Geobacillus phage vB_GthS_PK3.6]
MIELIAIPAITTVAAVLSGQKWVSDTRRLDTIFERCGLYIKKDIGGKIEHEKPKLIRRDKHEWGTEYVFRLPLGMSFEQVQAKYNEIRDGLNYKEGMDRHVEMFYEGALKIHVYFKPIPNRVPFNRELLALCNGWEVPIGKSCKDFLFHDFDKSPHMLVAGTTRYGKTVFLKNIITSLVVNQPENVIFSLIDLKGMLAFSRFESLRQVKYTASDGEETLDVLKKVVHEMKERQKEWRGKYEDIQEAGLKERHFIIIDEGAQLSSKGTRDATMRKILAECERLIEEIAAIGGGLGYRLIFATQYPLRENLPPTVKQNSDAKVVFRLQSEVASRTVMDEAGAEKLPRKDDKYKGGRAIYMTDAPVIVQTPFAENRTIEELISPYRIEKEEIHDSKESKESRGDIIQLGPFGVFNAQSDSKTP